MFVCLSLLATRSVADAEGPKGNKSSPTRVPDVAVSRLKELEAQEANLSSRLQAGPSEPTPAPPPPAEVSRKQESPQGRKEKNKVQAESTAKGAANKEKKSPEQELAELQAKYSASQKSVASLQQKCAEVETSAKRAEQAEDNLQRLIKELDETRGRLMVAETELERLHARYGGRETTNVDTARRRENPYAQNGTVDIGSMPGSISRDTPLATVVADNVSLRTGPGAQFPGLMTVPKGTSLAVEGRKGEWVRVITPMGARAWVYGTEVRLGQQQRPAPPRLNPPAAAPAASDAVSEDSEEAAFKSLTGGLKTNSDAPKQ